MSDQRPRAERGQAQGSSSEDTRLAGSLPAAVGPSEIFLVFLRLGLSSFGGPVAHLGYFREALVVRRRWLSEADYAHLVALCQFLPGPASSQVGIAIGLARAGLPGALAAWLGFTLPSAVAMAALGVGLTSLGTGVPTGVVHGLEVAVVAVVAHALAGMARTLCPDAARVLVAVLAAAFLLALPRVWAPFVAIAGGAIAGLVLVPAQSVPANATLHIEVSRRLAGAALACLACLLTLLPLAVATTGSDSLALADTFLRTGALVFGGGHVVLPLLQAELVPTGVVAADAFLAGYGVAQAVPGPLFTFAAYLGAVASSGPGGWIGAGLCVGAIFLPSFLLVVGALPFWNELRGVDAARSALAGINAAVVGLLLAAFIDPVWMNGIRSGADLLLSLAAWLLLARRAAPPWAVVVLAAGCGQWLALGVPA